MQKSLNVRETLKLVKLLDKAMQTTQQPLKFRLDIDIFKKELLDAIKMKKVNVALTFEELDFLKDALESRLEDLEAESWMQEPRQRESARMDARHALLKKISALLEDGEVKNG